VPLDGHEHRAERLEYLKRAVSARRMGSIAADARQRLDYLSAWLDAAAAERLKACRSRLEKAAARLDAVGPAATLQRGYAIARSKRGLVMAAGDVRPGEVIELILAGGRLLCRVLEERQGGGEREEHEGAG